jgi:histidinol-phosphate aminotransferase
VLSPRQPLLTIPSYHPPLVGRKGLRLDFNENTDTCSPHVLQRLRTLSADDLAKYPEREPVEAVIADFLKVRQGEVLLTNGVDQAIHLLCESYLDRGHEAIIVVPTYSMYAIYAKATGAEVIRVRAGRDCELPVAQVKNAITARTRLIAIANPNNPTGGVVSCDDLLHIAQCAPQAAVLVDEAYFEFYGKTVLDRRSQVRNLFATRTFSKAYGMAGLRLGVLVGDEGQMPAVRRVCSPYNVNAVALACLPAALADHSYIQDYVNEVLEGRARLQRVLEENGIHHWRSEANFILLRVGNSKHHAGTFVEQMRVRGILVRDRSADEDCEGCVRITLGRRQQVDQLLEALKEVFEQMGMAQGVSRL